tara:strand:+ start:872 stop:1324 length:453 start_codon:yes stop_codon:yes gene_type:complete
MDKLFTKSRLIDLILVFFITGFWDVVLRAMSEGRFSFLGIEKMKWVIVLKDYFDKHTILGAALIAAFVGAVTYPLIVYTQDKFNITNRIVQLIVVFLISGLVGIPMRYSGLFPILNEHYYKPLGFGYSFMTDAMSGVIVSISLFFLHLFI